MNHCSSNGVSKKIPARKDTEIIMAVAVAAAAGSLLTLVAPTGAGAETTACVAGAVCAAAGSPLASSPLAPRTICRWTIARRAGPSPLCTAGWSLVHRTIC